jgi:hypothetical protein
MLQDYNVSLIQKQGVYCPLQSQLHKIPFAVKTTKTLHSVGYKWSSVHFQTCKFLTLKEWVFEARSNVFRSYSYVNKLAFPSTCGSFQVSVV